MRHFYVLTLKRRKFHECNFLSRSRDGDALFAVEALPFDLVDQLI